jgi:hypothetical protein
VEKSISEYGKHTTTKDKLQCRCIQCIKIDKKKFYQKNKEKINDSTKKHREKNINKSLEYSRNYYNKNKEVLLDKKKIYYKKNYTIIYDKLKIYNKKNKEKINLTKNNYVKIKKSNDPLFKLKILMRDRLNKYYKYSSLNKNNTTFNIIGCTAQFLKEYLENQFTDGMNWNNHGLFGWHIDHIIPLSSANTEEELYKLCHYSNLQPLWAEDNLRKGNKII